MTRPSSTAAFLAAAGIAGATILVALVRPVALRAHGGHAGVAPVIREIQVGAERWSVALGTAPPDPVAGETIHLEVRVARVADAVRSAPAVSAAQVRLRVDGTPVELRPGSPRGVLAGELYEAQEAGDHRAVIEIAVDASTGARATTEFPVRVRPGPAAAVRAVLLTGAALLIAGAAATVWRRRRRMDEYEPRSLGGGAIGLGVTALIVFLLAGPMATILGQAFLPAREELEVDWVAETPPPAAPSPPAPAQPDAAARAGAPPRPAPASELPAGGGLATVVARVIAAPDRLAEVVVPMTGRIIPERTTVSVGARVAKGQTLASLQPTYIMHDALHLINQRWPILQSYLDSRRRMLEAEGTAERLRLALESKAVSLGEAQAADTAAAAAKQEYAKWSRTLVMHDSQIKDDLPQRVAIAAPIAGEIAVANFAQGQLVYEADPLFTVVDLTTVWVEAKVPEPLVSRFHRDTVHLLSATFPDVTFTGRLERIAPAVDPVTRTLSHFYAVRNAQRLLKIGMSMTVQLGTGPIAAAS